MRAMVLLGPCAHRIWKFIASQRGGRCRRLVFVLLARSAPRWLVLLFSGAFIALYIYKVCHRACRHLNGTCWPLFLYYMSVLCGLLVAPFLCEWLLFKCLQGLFSPHLHHQEPYEPESKTLPTVFGHYVQPLSGGFKTSHNTIHKAEILQYSA